MSSTKDRDRDRDNYDSYVRMKSRMTHNPPDRIDFVKYPFDGDERQVCNFSESLYTEFKAHGIDTMVNFTDYPEIRKPRGAYRRIDNGTADRHDKQAVRDYEEVIRKDNLMFSKGKSIVQLLTTHTIFADFSREISRLRELDAPVLSVREIFSELIMNFFQQKYLNEIKLARVMTKITREIQLIPIVTHIYGVKVLIDAIYSKEENCITISWWTENNEYTLSQKELKTILFSKLAGKDMQYFISMLGNFAYRGAVRTFHEIADELKEMISQCDLDAMENKMSYDMISDTQVTQTNTHLLHNTTHQQDEYMQDQNFEVNANAQGQTCFNCGSPSHLISAC